MSFRAFGRLIYNAGVQVVVRLGLYGLRAPLPFRPQTLKPSIRTVRDFQLARRFFGRALNATLRTKHAARPFAAFFHGNRDSTLRYSTSRSNRRFVRFRQKFQFLDHVKRVFGYNSRYNQVQLVEELPVGLANYEIGNFIACGCNAAVYEVDLKTDGTGRRRLSPLIRPLALKIMFNYDFSLPERRILQDMSSELIPLAGSSVRLPTGTFGTLKQTHPNIIKMFAAFVDRMPVLDGADRLYPEALPSADIFGSLVYEPRTLFVVMKRYRMTLREFCLTRKRNYWAGRVMFGQLLEAVCFLFDKKISHRDMKSDNVLLDFNSDDEIPYLVLSDFGSAMTESMVLRYEDEFTNLGGNLSLRAPEISRAKLSPGTLIDYKFADLWSSGTLGIEIFTRRNPFYSCLSSATYDDEYDLPELPRRCPSAIKKLINRILRVEPHERPTPHCAANVVSLSLFRFGREIRAVLEELGLNVDWMSLKLDGDNNGIVSRISGLIEEKMDDFVGHYVAETITARLISPTIISPSELQLRTTFLSRLNRQDLWSAMEHLVDSSVHDLQSSLNSNLITSSGESTIFMNA